MFHVKQSAVALRRLIAFYFICREGFKLPIKMQNETKIKKISSYIKQYK